MSVSGSSTIVERCTCVIPARHGSTRFPGKPLADLAGVPLVVRVCRRAAAIPEVDLVCVATDDERIREIVEKHGFKAIMTDTQLSSGTDRVYAASIGLSGDLILNLQGDEPLIDIADVGRLIQTTRKEREVGIATLAVKADLGESTPREIVRVHINDTNYATSFARSGVASLKHLGVYLFRRPALKQFISLPCSSGELAHGLEQLRALDNGMQIRVVIASHSSPAVDVPEDLSLVIAEMEKRAATGYGS